MADRYWVGDGGNWNNIAHWAAGTGGAGGETVPTNGDNVFFDNLSFTLANQTVTVNIDASCLDMDWSTVTNSPKLAVSNYLNVYGDLTLFGMTYVAGGYPTRMRGAGAGLTLTTNGITIPSLTLNGAGDWTLQDALTVTGDIDFERGTLDTADQTVTLGSDLYFGGTSAKVLTLGASVININGAYPGSGYFYISSGTSSITVNAETSTINCAALVNVTGTNFGITLYDVVCTLPYAAFNPLTPNSIMTLRGFTGFNNLTITQTSSGTAVWQKMLAVGCGNDITIADTLTLTGFSASRRIFVFPIDPLNPGEQVTITAETVALTNVDFQDIVGAGTASPFTGTSIGDCGNTGGITGDTPVTVYWVGDGGNWSDNATHWSATSGGAAGAPLPLPQDTVRFNENSFSVGAQTVTVDLPTLGGDIDWTDVTNTPTWLIYQHAGETRRIFLMFGSLTLAAGMAISGNAYDDYVHLYMAGRGTTYLTTNGIDPCGTSAVAWYGILTIYAGNGTVALSDDLTTNGLYVFSGTFDANDFNINITSGGFGLLVGTSTLGQVLMYNSNYDCTIKMGAGSNWSFHNSNFTVAPIGIASNPGDITITCETSICVVNPSVAVTGTVTFAFAQSITLYDLIVNGTNTITTDYSFLFCSGVSTFTTITMNDLTIQNARVAMTLRSAKTYTVGGTFTAEGSGDNMITITSSTAGSRANLGAGVAVVSFVNVKDNNADGAAAPFDATTFCIDSGNNLDWDFEPSGKGISWF